MYSLILTRCILCAHACTFGIPRGFTIYIYLFIYYIVSSRIVAAFFLAVFGPKAFVFVRKYRHCSVGARMFSYRRWYPHSFLYIFYIISPLFSGGRHISTPKLPLSRWDKKKHTPTHSRVYIYPRLWSNLSDPKPISGFLDRSAGSAGTPDVHLFTQIYTQCTLHTRIIHGHTTLPDWSRFNGPILQLHVTLRVGEIHNCEKSTITNQ